MPYSTPIRIFCNKLAFYKKFFQKEEYVRISVPEHEKKDTRDYFSIILKLLQFLSLRLLNMNEQTML